MLSLLSRRSLIQNYNFVMSKSARVMPSKANLLTKIQAAEFTGPTKPKKR